MQKHSHATPEGRAFWYTERLWKLAAGRPVTTVAVDSIAEFDQSCWFIEPPTCRQVAEHARRILQADLSHPVILSADGRLMDGGHRLARAWLEGRTEVTAQRFETDPAPDYVETPVPATTESAR
jgi:hypothetical protein